MRTQLSIVILLFTHLLPAQETIYDIINIDSCQGIEVVGVPDLYVGDNLFDLINGGAELYHEYGFVEVLAAEMTIPGGNPVKVEIYDMGSSEGAWGIYSATTNLVSCGAPAFGKANGIKGDGYAQWMRGKYMAYMYFDTIQDTDLRSLGACLAGNIILDGKEPHIKALLWMLGDKCKRTVYFKGNLGLSSIYNFHYKDVFGYNEGAAAIFPDVTIFLLDYEDEGLCTEGYIEAKDFFMQSSKYHDQTSLRGSFHMKDRKEQQIDCYFENTFLIIFIYEGEMELNSVREDIIDSFEHP